MRSGVADHVGDPRRARKGRRSVIAVPKRCNRELRRKAEGEKLRLLTRAVRRAQGLVGRPFTSAVQPS